MNKSPASAPSARTIPCTRFFRNTSGNVAPVFGLMAIPLLAITGAAVDFGKAISVQTEMQNVIDAAAVSSAMEYASTGDVAAAETRLRKYISAEIENHGLELNAPPTDGTQAPTPPSGNKLTLQTAGISTVSNSVTPVLQANINTSILKLVGIPSIPLEVTSTAQLSGKKLELSLMLDVTGSMNDKVGGVKKIDSMKEAANDLLDIFRVNMAAGASRIALAPFSESVNVGDYAEAFRGSTPNGTSQTPGRKKFKFRDRNNNWKTWNITNCVSERTGSQAYTDAPPTQAYLGRVYRSSTSCVPSQEIVPLSTNETMLRNVVNGLGTGGGTAGHLGTSMAWYMVSDKWAPVWPEASKPEAPDTDKLIKATILMTDGDYNTEHCKGVNDSTINCNAENGSSKNQAAALCTQMKNSGVVVYSVGFGISQGSSQETLLKNCATDNTKYFFPYNGQQLRAAFSEIGRQLHAGQAGVKLMQ